MNSSVDEILIVILAVAASADQMLDFLIEVSVSDVLLFEKVKQQTDRWNQQGSCDLQFIFLSHGLGETPHL